MITEKTPVAKIMREACQKRILIPAFNVAYVPMVRRSRL